MEDDNYFGPAPKNDQEQEQRTIPIPNRALEDLEALDLEKVLNSSETERPLGSNSRCVSVDTILPAPLGRRKKRVFRGKGDLVKFRCTVYEKKLLGVKAKMTGLSLSEYVRRTVFEQTVRERFTEEQIELYKVLVKYHNNFKSIGNMFRKRNPALAQKVHELADEIKSHLKKFQE